MPGKPWPDATRTRAAELAADRDLSISDVRRAVAEELGASVPIDTMSRWVREARLSTPIDRPAVLRDVADRAAWLLSSEVSRLERQTPRSRDLARLDQIARTLKTLSSIEQSKPGAQRQTLADLSGRGAATEEPKDPEQRRAA